MVPICDLLTQTCTFDMIIQADVSSVDVVIDVAGYFLTFPTGDIMPIVLANDGPGSGLDADFLDNLTSANFQQGPIQNCAAGSSIRAINVWKANRATSTLSGTLVVSDG